MIDLQPFFSLFPHSGYVEAPPLPKIPGGDDAELAKFDRRLEHADYPLRDRMLAHMSPPDNADLLANAPAQVQYFDHIVSTSLARNPHMSAEQKQRIHRKVIQDVVAFAAEAERREQIETSALRARQQAREEEERARAAQRAADAESL